MKRRTFIKTTLLTGTALATPCGMFSAAGDQSRPGWAPFSWNRVPVYRHSDPRRTPFSPAELDLLSEAGSFVTVERSRPLKDEANEMDSIFATVRELKQRNPAAAVLYYWNTFINRSPWVKGYRTEWNLKDRSGKEITKFDRFSRPDLSLPEAREWWSDVVAATLRDVPFDGIFADALPQVLTPALPKQVGEAKAKKIVEGLQLMLAATRKKIGPDKIILANALRVADNRHLLKWDSISGFMIEHFNSFGCESKEAIRTDLESLTLAEQNNKFCVLKAWPGFTWLDPFVKDKTEAELLKLARERITFPLACFLVGARTGSFFSYSWGYHDEHGMLVPYPEFTCPLGAPKADAVWRGDTATREFAHAAVSVDLARKTARVQFT